MLSLWKPVGALAALVGLAACSSAPEEGAATATRTTQEAITGGLPAQGSAPEAVRTSVVALAPNADFFGSGNARSAYCSGVLIGEGLVLTAAHCVELMDRVMTLVVFGPDMVSAKRAKTYRQATRVVKHPGYPDYYVEQPWGRALRNDYVDAPEKWMSDHPGTAPDDLALVAFQGGTPAGYAPAELAAADDEDPSSTLLAGYGVTSSTKLDDSGVLRYVDDVEVYAADDDTRARHFLAAATTLDVARILRGERPRGACPGDSGGPAFVHAKDGLRLSGILSLGEGERAGPDSTMVLCLGHAPGGAPKVGNLYTDVRAYRDWIGATSRALTAGLTMSP
jgi:secreted trypsin-like serine protease